MGKRRGKGRCAKNAKRAVNADEPEDLVKAPHCFVINRGVLGKNAQQLMLNFRKVMEPYTASQLRVRKKNVLKDFVHIAGPFNVTHLTVFTKSEIGMYMRVIRLPRGPTMTFRIHEYTLAKDVLSSLKKALMYEQLFSHHPLLVLNNFSGEGMHLKLLTTMFQGMFPTININKANLNSIRRCLLLNYNEDKTIELRHYAIKLTPCGLSRAAKKLVQSKVPDLGQYNDVSEYMDAGNLSESEPEMDGPTNQVVLSQPISSRGNITSQKSAIRLHELGPRIKLQLIKIEEGIATGDVLYHEFIKKTPEEVAALKAMKKKKMLLKAQRKAIQDQNVKRKQQEAESRKNPTNGAKADQKDEYEEAIQYQEQVDAGSTGKKRKLNADTKPNKKVKFSDKDSKEKSASKEKSDLQTFLARKKKRKAAKQKKKRIQKKSAKARSKKR